MDATKGNFESPNSVGNEMISTKAYTIGGVPIMFPYRAYPSQITMMDKIVKCLNKKLNCLLESPTGSGKSLALLCSCLAWQKKIKKEIDELEEKLEKELNSYGVTIPDENGVKSDFKCADKKGVECCSNGQQCSVGDEPIDKRSPMETKLNSFLNKYKYREKEKGIVYIDSPPSVAKSIEIHSKLEKKKPVIDNLVGVSSKQDSTPSKYFEKDASKRGWIDSDFEDFQPFKKHRKSTSSPHTSVVLKSPVKETHAPLKEKLLIPTGLQTDSALDATPLNSFTSIEKPDKEKVVETSIPTKLPKIYYGTRTHKQIEQIIRELKKTPYKDSNMTILSSRQRTCIHPEASRADNINEACNDLLNDESGSACKYHRMAKTISHFHPPKLGTAFDLEDFVKICRKSRACPYFSSRELLPASDIVFCPYNYLIDPLIREAMQISLKNSIVIFDEAHNIEDSARDAASNVIPLSQINDSIFNLEKISRFKKELTEHYMYLAKILTNIKDWLIANSHNLSDYSSFNSSSKVWAGDNMLAILNYVDLGPSTFPDFKKKLEKILAEENSKENEAPINMDEPKLLATTKSCLENLTQSLTYLYKSDLVYVPDFRCAIVKSKVFASGRRNSSLTQNPFELTLNFWCLNPAVAFSDIKGVTHTVIVASGTLSPLTSFQSELGIPFQLTLEANHVISTSQMWVGTIGKGINNNSLTATYHNAATFRFQDDVGNLVFHVCCTIPYGVLCFLPSYSMLDNLVNRWQQTGLWGKLLSRKVVVCEPRRQNQLLQVMDEFYEAIKESEMAPQNRVNGALMLAVCRGKISEGLDFADNNARAVITIGIPFPNFKEAQVDLKRKYNDLYSSKRKIMTGSDWYETQAFRALNQALGRCIRHSKDFGALIIVDERFQKNNRFPNALSKWIRREIVHFPTFPDAMNSLNDFAEQTGLKKSELSNFESGD